MAGYLRWLADSAERLPNHVREQVAELRNMVRANHPRTGNNVAQLMVGISCALEYARSIDAISESDAKSLRERAWNALLDAAQRQESHHRQARPEQRFVELLMSAIGSGRAHVADRDGAPPGKAEAWGWRPHVVGAADYAENRWEPQGLRVGWLDAEALYLDRAAAFRAAAEMDVENGIGVSVETLVKRLYQAGQLATISSERDGRLTVQRRLEGTKRRVLHLRVTAEGLLPRQTGDIGDAGATARSLIPEHAGSGPDSVPGIELSGSKPGT
jgi:hypothetical protein